ncbi:MAG: signal peptidase I [Acidobacteriota bacterium]|nr:signal peptidase I [Acidobacteriota bacterium]MDH3785458.1 signal peptidase I [Acidobacteriota bacterium]
MVIRTVFAFLVGVIFVYTFVAKPASIPSRSMEDTLLIGDQIVINRFAYGDRRFGWESVLPLSPPGRGDVVVFRHPDTPEIDYVKRIVGLPGETIEFDDGVVLINGQPLDEPYLNRLYLNRRPSPAVRVPLDHYFVMGDHRLVSTDSRRWGTVPRDLLGGPAGWILASRGRWERAFRRIR